jgi:thioester reductase-like protein
MNRNKALLTGSNGFLGSYLLGILLKEGYTVYAIARSAKGVSARERVIKAVEFWDKSVQAAGLTRLKVIEGDIALPGLGITDTAKAAEIAAGISVVFHGAALANLTTPYEKIRAINVEGSRNVFDFVLASGRKREIRLNHISTAYIAGDLNKPFTENMLEMNQTFHNTYERTKYEAELLARGYADKEGLDISILRPGMIMGDYASGKTSDFRLFYEPLRAIAGGLYDTYPLDVNCSQNLINADTAAKAVFLLGTRADKGVYHIVSPESTNLGGFFELAAGYFGFKKPVFSKSAGFDYSKWTAAQRLLASPFVPYFNTSNLAVSDMTRKTLSELGLEVPRIDNANLCRVFEYCHKTGHIRKK